MEVKGKGLPQLLWKNKEDHLHWIDSRQAVGGGRRCGEGDRLRCQPAD